MYKTKKKKNRG